MFFHLTKALFQLTLERFKKALTNSSKFGASPFVKRKSFFGGATYAETKDTLSLL